MASWAKLADVARVNPAFVVSDRFAIALPVSRRDVFTAHKDLTVVAQLHFLPRDGFSDRAVSHAKRMRKTRERSRLRHAVSLNDCVAEAAPEGFRVAFQSCTAGNEGPEAPSKLAMYVSEGPPVF